VVLVPVFGHPNDEVALATVRDAFPGRYVVGIDCTPMVEGLGAIHCVTQQQPGTGAAAGVTCRAGEEPSRQE
jgi:agmatine deiminase